MITLNNLFDYKAAKRAEEGGSRHYLTESGQKVASVTTILSKTKDPAPLIAWRKRIGEAAANQITKESTDLGTLMHTHLENYIKGEDRPGGTNFGRVMAAKMADQIIANGLAHVDEVWGIEVPLIFDTFWAGTSDLVGVYKGEPAIMDFKTTIRPKTRERVDDYRLQTVAYSTAHDNMFGTKIRKLVIFMCSRDFQYQQFEFGMDDYERDQMDWLHRVEQYYRDHS
jgi:genome maintenance exonuclease 1